MNKWFERNRMNGLLLVIISLLACLLVFLLFKEDSRSLPPGLIQVESNGAKGNGVADDTLAIQETIDQVSKRKSGTVWLQPGKEYVITSTIFLKEGVELRLGHNTRLQIDGDFTAISIEKNASLNGGVIEIINSSFDSEVIYMDGKQKFYGIWDSTQIENVNIVNSINNLKGTALSLYAAGPSHFISFINFQNISISGFATGVKLLTKDPEKGEYSWINGNRFQNFSMENCLNFIVLDGHESIPNESSGNLFTNMQIQLNENTQKVLSVDGSDNRFDGVVWDVQTLSHSEPIVFLTDQSYNNTVHFNLDPKYLNNEGQNNRISFID